MDKNNRLGPHEIEIEPGYNLTFQSRIPTWKNKILGLIV